MQSLFKKPGIATASAVAGVFPPSVEKLKQLASFATDEAKSTVSALESESQSLLSASKPVPFELARKVDLAAAEFSARVGIVAVVKNVAVEKELRDAATAALVELQNTSIDLFTSNRQLYRLLKGVEAPALPSDAKPDSVPAQQRYWLADKLEDYERDGHGLPDDQFAKVVQLKKDLAKLSTDFNTNVAEDKTTLVFTPAELAGVPESVLQSLKKASECPHVPAEASAAKGPDALAVGMDYPTYFAVMKNCTVAETRHTVGRAFNRRAFPANQEVLQKVVGLRRELAGLLGFASYSDLDLASKMAKEPATAQKFIDDLVPGLQAKWQLEQEKLKAALPPSVQLDAKGQFNPYDVVFAKEDFKRKFLSVDETEIQQYFPVDSTVAALLRIYEQFFDVEFVHHSGDAAKALGLWHEEVSVIEVRDKRDGGNILGFVALDLFPRDGKYSHACCHAMIPAVRNDDDGTFTPAVSVVIANFPAPTPSRPALLLHSDAETFFHEFGHAMHGMFGRPAMATLAGTRVKRDFVELPSQILEEWLWQPAIVDIVAKHYKTGEKLPAELLKRKLDSKTAFSGHESLRQLQFATLSLQLFGKDMPKEVDADTFFKTDIQQRIMPGVAVDDEARFTNAFGHLMGYGAAYYGYMWSEVFAVDIFEAIRAQDGLLNADIGRRYSKSILEIGGNRDPADMLTEFLGRPANNTAFLRRLGIDAK